MWSSVSHSPPSSISASVALRPSLLNQALFVAGASPTGSGHRGVKQGFLDFKPGSSALSRGCVFLLMPLGWPTSPAGCDWKITRSNLYKEYSTPRPPLDKRSFSLGLWINKLLKNYLCDCVYLTWKVPSREAGITDGLFFAFCLWADVVGDWCIFNPVSGTRKIR